MKGGHYELCIYGSYYVYDLNAGGCGIPLFHRLNIEVVKIGVSMSKERLSVILIAIGITSIYTVSYLINMLSEAYGYGTIPGWIVLPTGAILLLTEVVGLICLAYIGCEYNIGGKNARCSKKCKR